MHRIDGPGATAGNLFTEEDPVLGIDPTQHTADWNNAVQEELAGLVEGTGAALNKADNTQVDTAVRSIARAEAGGFRNLLHNGDLRLWRRGTTVTLPGDFGPDRWQCTEGSGGSPAATITRQEHVVVTPNSGSRHFLRWDQTVGASADAARLRQRTESVRTWAGEEVTLSVRARSTSGTKDVTPYVEQNFGSGGTPSTTVRTTGPTWTWNTTWNTYSWTFTIPALTAKTIGTDEGSDFLESVMVFDGTATFEVEVDQVQLELGAGASAFELVPLEVELTRCARFFETSYELNVTPGTAAAKGWLTDEDYLQAGEPFTEGHTFAGLNDRFRVPMRDTPTVVWFNPADGTEDEIYMVTRETGTPVNHNFTPNTHTNRATKERTGAPLKSTGLTGAGNYVGLEAHYTADAEW